MDTKRYFKIVEEFNNSGLPNNGTHSLMNFVHENYPDEYEYVCAVYEYLTGG